MQRSLSLIETSSLFVRSESQKHVLTPSFLLGNCIEYWIHALKKDCRTGEMAQRLEALTTLLEVLSSNPSNHMVAPNHL